MNNIKVSVIIPVYNGGKYVGKCLDTLLSQTLKELEIVVVNDGSSDNTDQILSDYANKHKDKIKYISIENGGVSNARNIALENSTGEYITFCDCDDYVELDMCEELYNKAILTGADVVVSGYFSENEKGDYTCFGLEYMDKYSNSLEDRPDILFVSNPFVHNKLFSRSLIEKSGIKFQKYKIFEDMLFAYSLMLIANKIEKVNRPFYHYIRRKSDSVTGVLGPKFYDLFSVMKDLRAFYEKTSSVDFTEQITFVAIHHAYLRFTVDISIKEYKFRYQFIKATYKFLDEFNPNWKNNYYFEFKKKTSKKYKGMVYWLYSPIEKKLKIRIKNIKKKLKRIKKRLRKKLKSNKSI